jgi:hypothetical protein
MNPARLPTGAEREPPDHRCLIFAEYDLKDEAQAGSGPPASIPDYT